MCIIGLLRPSGWERADAITTVWALQTSSLADLGGGFGQVRSIQFVPGGLESARVLILSALIPWLALAATQMPLVDLLQTLAKFLLSLRPAWRAAVKVWGGSGCDFPSKICR